MTILPENNAIQYFEMLYQLAMHGLKTATNSSAFFSVCGCFLFLHVVAASHQLFLLPDVLVTPEKLQNHQRLFSEKAHFFFKSPVM